MGKKVKVGFLPLYIKLYDDAGVKRDATLKCMNAAIKMLESEDVEIAESSPNSTQRRSFLTKKLSMPSLPIILLIRHRSNPSMLCAQ